MKACFLQPQTFARGQKRLENQFQAFLRLLSSAIKHNLFVGVMLCDIFSRIKKLFSFAFLLPWPLLAFIMKGSYAFKLIGLQGG